MKSWLWHYSRCQHLIRMRNIEPWKPKRLIIQRMKTASALIDVLSQKRTTGYFLLCGCRFQRPAAPKLHQNWTASLTGKTAVGINRSPSNIARMAGTAGRVSAFGYESSGVL